MSGAEVLKLQEEYRKRGIGYVHNGRTHKVYLTILGAPFFAEGVPKKEKNRSTDRTLSY